MIKVGIVGGTGYTGVELLRILASHPKAEATVITSRAEAGRPVSDIYPNLRGHCDLRYSEPNTEALLECDVVFFATPHGVAQSMMAELIKGGARVIDLSADFRIRDIDTWEEWYGQKHGCPDLVGQAVYGLPELNRDKIKDANLIACPGCYPTTILLGFMPLLEAGLVNTDALIASASSGITGAGRQGKIDLLLAENSESYKAYAAGGHRHLPELEQGLQDIQAGEGKPARITFVPHLLPMVRGMHATLYSQLLKKGVDLQSLYEERFANEPFVDVLPPGQLPQTRSVRGSNTCRISVLEPQQRGTAVVLSAIDNLTKGASGQGVQNMNIMFGLDETLGMMAPAVMP